MIYVKYPIINPPTNPKTIQLNTSNDVFKYTFLLLSMNLKSPKPTAEIIHKQGINKTVE